MGGRDTQGLISVVEYQGQIGVRPGFQDEPIRRPHPYPGNRLLSLSLFQKTKLEIIKKRKRRDKKNGGQKERKKSINYLGKGNGKKDRRRLEPEKDKVGGRWVV